MERDPEKIVNEVVRILLDEQLSKSWDSTNGEMCEGFGKLGVMSPLNRMAFVKVYGEDYTRAFELDAREIIRQREEAFANSEYSKHAKQADAFNGIPKEGDFVWCSNSGMKRDDGGAIGEIEDLIRYKEYDGRLCKVVKVINVADPYFLDSGKADLLVREFGLQSMGGSCSEDLPDDADIYNLTQEQLRTFYTKGVAVVWQDGECFRWYLIDTEGYDYSRYIYMPADWREMYKSQVQQIEHRIEMEEAKAKEEAALAKQKCLNEYQARSAKWLPLMVDVNPLYDEERNAFNELRKAGYKKGCPEYETLKAAKRKLLNARKKNIMSMVKAVFPEIKFSLTTEDGDYEFDLYWNDGPTQEQLNDALDLTLFEHGRECFDGFDDSTYYQSSEFCEFADFTMGKGHTRGEVCLHRSTTPEYREQIERLLRDAHGITAENYESKVAEICALPGVERFHVYHYNTFKDVVEYVARLWNIYITEDLPVEKIKAEPIQGKYGIVEYSDKAIIVTGDTKPIRKLLSELGGRFHPKLSVGAGWIFSKKKEAQVRKLLNLE